MLTRRARSGPLAGNALILSVTAVMVVSILAAGFLQLALSVTRRLSSSADTAQALNIAEAGLAEAYMGLAVARTGDVGSQLDPAVFGGGLFWVESTEQGALVELECTALYGTGRATLGMVCEPVSSSVTTLGFFSSDDLRLNPRVRVDSYDSAQGTYAEQVNTPLNNHGLVGSNGDLTIGPDGLVFGDAVPGPGGTLDLQSGAVVTGETTPRPEVQVLPPIEVPDVLLAAPKVHTGGIPLVVPPGEAGFESLEIGKNSKVVLKGPLTLVTGELMLRSSAEMIFDTTDGPIEVYVGDSLDLKSGSLVSNTTQSTSDSLIFVSGAGKVVNLGSKAEFHGFIYAPQADVHIAAQYELFGGLVCKSLHVSANGALHYDLDLSVSLEMLLPLMHSWRVVELPKQAAVKRIDPFKLLGLDPANLRLPAAAHADQMLEVKYVAADGTTDSYVGLESDFDWSLVTELLYGVRDGVAFLLPDMRVRPNTAAADPLVDLVGSSMTSKDLRDALLAASPVSPEALAAACARNPPMSKSDLKNVLDANRPLPDQGLLAAILSAALDSSTLRNVLIDNSPLAPSVLTAVLTRLPPLALGDLTSVLLNQ